MGTSKWGALLAALALTAAGCGGSSEGGPGEGGGNAAPVEGTKGGKVTFLAAADVDYLDPGQTYYTFGYTVAYATNRPLYSFEPDDAETPVPDLAEGEPLISADNRTITVKLPGRALLAAGQPRGHRRRRQVRVRAGVHPERPLRLRHLLLRRHHGRAGRPWRVQVDRGDQGPRRPHAPTSGASTCSRRGRRACRSPPTGATRARGICSRSPPTPIPGCRPRRSPRASSSSWASSSTSARCRRTRCTRASAT